MSINNDIKHLINGCKKGDERAQHAFFNEHNRLLFSVAMRYLKNRAEAEDALQEAWLQIFKSIKNYEEEGRLIYWLKKIVIRICWKSIKSKRAYVDLETIQHPHSVSLDISLIDKMTCEEILFLLEEVPFGSREVFKMFVIEGLSHEEIGSVLQIQQSTSRAHLAKARKILKKKYNSKNSYSHERISAS